MSIVAETYDFVIGVDTHAKHHAYAILTANTAAMVDERVFPTTPAGRARACAWIRNRTPDARILVAVEGAGSYGKTLTQDLQKAGIPVCDVRPPTRASRSRHGKTDAFDARAAAKEVLPLEADKVVTPRYGDALDALQILNSARQELRTVHSHARNQLTALLRSYDLGYDARKAPIKPHLETISRWRPRTGDSITVATARAQAAALASRALTMLAELKSNEAQLKALVQIIEPSLLDIRGVGPVSAAIILCAYGQPGRVRNADAFNNMAGIAPLPVQSGNTSYARLNRGGNRQLNSAIHTIMQSRLRDPETKAYIAKREAEGKGERAIKRCLKRYIGRQIFKHLDRVLNPTNTPVTA